MVCVPVSGNKRGDDLASSRDSASSMRITGFLAHSRCRRNVDLNMDLNMDLKWICVGTQIGTY